MLHTSKQEGGQIFVTAINWILYVGVLLLIGIFQSSAKLADAYGLAVTGTLLLTSVLFLTLARHVWHVAAWKWWVYLVLVGGLELVYFLANLVKIVSGGWLPLLIASVICMIMVVWRRGHNHMFEARRELEGEWGPFIARLDEADLPRVPGLAVFPHPTRHSVPLALRRNVDFNRVLHHNVVVVTIVNENVPHIRHTERVEVIDLDDKLPGLTYVRCRVGFNDSPDVPKALALAIETSPILAGLHEKDARYYLSVSEPHEDAKAPFDWRRKVFIWLAHNAADGAQTLRLPVDRTVVMGCRIDV